MVVFEGETMTCFICGKVKKHDPAKASNWMHFKVLDTGEGMYICPKHRNIRFERAEELLKKVIEKEQGQPAMPFNWQIEADRPKGITTLKISVPPTPDST